MPKKEKKQETIKKETNKNKQLKPNAYLESKREDGYFHLYATLEDGTHVQLRLAFYNDKLQYKLHKVLNNGNKQ